MTLTLRYAACFLAAALSGCAVGQFFAPSEPETLVVVVPSKDDGHVGAVVVNPGPGQQVLDTAYASARTRKGSKPKVKTLAAGDLDKSFAAAREAAPPAPVTFTVHFVLGTNLLTSASRDIMGRVIDEVARRPSADVMVIGHTDQMGPEEYNDLLSLRRAESVRDFMAGRGVRREIIRTAGHGEREPLYTVEDGRLSSPENRRVEITVR